ncbi:unnamed protein product [Citrullus colocynthis]|uniref:Uncharacterized protein n=1 Tax=Citrullus colocynthis TaxID=252529 RepID=A0ABP0YR74_9ROSI
MAEQTLFLFVLMSIFISLNAQKYQFEYFQMVQQWGPAVCTESGVHCFAQPKPLFTVHGLWPSNFTNPYLPCPPGVTFDQSQVTALVPQLETYWPDLLDGNDQKLWKHEWEKHGTCSDPPFNVLQYFQTTLNIRTRYDVLNILNVAGFGPSSSNQVNYSDIEDPIKAITKKKPHLRCNHNGVTKERQLLEIVLCFADDGVTFIHCPTLNKQCPDKFIWLPQHSLVTNQVCLA